MRRLGDVAAGFEAACPFLAVLKEHSRVAHKEHEKKNSQRVGYVTRI